jgi:hypothetical protein
MLLCNSLSPTEIGRSGAHPEESIHVYVMEYSGAQMGFLNFTQVYTGRSACNGRNATSKHSKVTYLSNLHYNLNTVRLTDSVSVLFNVYLSTKVLFHVKLNECIK